MDIDKDVFLFQIGFITLQMSRKDYMVYTQSVKIIQNRFLCLFTKIIN